jgi:hypothetical protein
MKKLLDHKSHISGIENKLILEDDRTIRSQKRYMERKQFSKQSVIDAGLILKGSRVSIVDDRDRSWRIYRILECIIKWTENGTEPRVTHILQEIDQLQRSVGDEFECDLEKVHYIVSTIEPPAPGVKGTGSNQFIGKKLRALKRLENLEVEAEGWTRQRNAAIEDYKRQENVILEVHRKQFRQKLRENNEMVARKFMSTDRHAKKLVLKLAGNMKVKVLNADGSPNFIRSQALALATTQELFVENRIAQRKDELSAAFHELEQAAADRIDEYADEIDVDLDKSLAELNMERDEIQVKMDKWRYTEGKVMLSRVRFDPDVFSKALCVPSKLCQHIRAKAWGNEYGMGVKCVTCGKELSLLFEEENQYKGYGSGTEAWMSEALTRHRGNEESFRFKNSEELHLVEVERRRVEKELREIDEKECYFYDFAGIRVLYEFDRRHRVAIKKDGAFRQGLQWTLDEIEQFERNETQSENQRMLDNGFLLENQETEFEPLQAVLDPPPTYRGIQIRHRAQYQDMLHNLSRLANFQKRINILKEERLLLLEERGLFGGVLELLHQVYIYVKL